MGEVIVGATMSLDGFINDRNGDLDPLYPDMDAMREADPLPGENERLRLVFVTDGIESAIRQAKAAAGDKDVTVVGGASTAQQCMRAGLADRIDIYLAPLLLGEGLPLFEQGSPRPIRLETISAKQVRWSMPGVTLVRYRPVA